MSIFHTSIKPKRFDDTFVLTLSTNYLFVNLLYADHPQGTF